MLLKYGASNFFCFKEGVEISFKLNDNCPISISNGKSYTNVICVKGANGSGKTNALKILSTFADFCSNSFAKKPDERIKIEPFFYNSEPTEFYIEFLINNVEYRYEIELTGESVISEKIFRKKRKSVLIVERINNELVDPIREFDELKIVKLRSNASLISTANQYEISCMKPIYLFFTTIISNIDFFGLNNFEPELSSISKFYYDNPDFFEFAKEIICKCDLGVDNIVIDKKEAVDGEETYMPFFLHKYQGEEKVLTYFTQSNGTQTLYFNLFRYKMVLLMGGILVLDEFDINLHPHILPVLMNLFTNPVINKNDSQLIFTTHNAEIMNVMGKYRTFLINKEDNESYGYRLDEIPGDIIRNDRLISPIYNDGKIGGVPKL